MVSEDVDLEGARLLAAVARLNRWATRHAELRIPPAQGRLLSLIDQIGPARIGALAHADHCSQPTMTTQVQRLEAAGWATRSADDSDARVALIQLTDEGREQLERLRAARAAALAPELARLSAEERAALRSATEIILRVVHPDDRDQ